MSKALVAIPVAACLLRHQEPNCRQLRRSSGNRTGPCRVSRRVSMPANSRGALSHYKVAQGRVELLRDNTAGAEKAACV